MPNATHNPTPADALAAIIAAGVAAYQSALPEYARDASPFVALPNHAREAGELPEPEPVITLNEETQRRLCLSCPLPECAGVESEACPIRIEQRAEWRRKDRMTKGVDR